MFVTESLPAVRGSSIREDYQSTAKQYGRAAARDKLKREAALMLEAGRRGDSGGYTFEDFSLKDLFRELVVDEHGDPCGDNIIRQWEGRYGDVSFQEAEGAVDSTMFNDITGQLVFSEIRRGFMNPAFVLTNLVRKVPSRIKNEETIPSIANMSDPGDPFLLVNEEQEYPTLGFGREKIQIPAKKKRGFKVNVTREAIMFDLTGDIITKASKGGEILGMGQEKRLASLILGGSNTYKEATGSDADFVSRQTYYGIGDATKPWINHLDANGLDDWTDVDTLTQLFNNMEDPTTGEPIMLGGMTLLCTPGKQMTARRIVTAAEVRHTTTDNNGQTAQTIGANPLSSYNVQASIYLHRILQNATSAKIPGLNVSAANANEYWWLGDFSQAFAIYFNWDIETTQAPANNPAMFNQDITASYKASHRSVEAITQPRYVLRCRSIAGTSSSNN